MASKRQKQLEKMEAEQVSIDKMRKKLIERKENIEFEYFLHYSKLHRTEKSRTNSLIRLSERNNRVWDAIDRLDIRQKKLSEKRRKWDMWEMKRQKQSKS